MFPTKISLVAAALVLILTALMYQASTSSLSRIMEQRTKDQVERAAGLFLSQNRLQALEFTNETAQYARMEVFSKIFSIADETQRRTAAHEAVNALNEQHIAKAHDRRAALVAVVDAGGKVVARDLNINALYGEDMKGRYPAVAAALSGSANKDVWAFNNRMYRVSCAPIRGADGKVIGALVVGFEESGNDARALRDAFGTDVVEFLDGKIYASNFAVAGKPSVEEQELAKVLFAGPGTSAVKQRRQTEPFRVTLRGENFLAVAAPLLGNTSQPEAGFVVLSSLDQALQPVRRAGGFLLGLGLLATLITMAAAIWTSRRFLVTIDKIEQGVTEIINGNHDYIFEKQGNIDFEGLENALNVMVARLLGRPEPSEMGMTSTMDLATSGLTTSRPDAPAPAGSVRLSPENQALANEPEDKYRRRLFDEYVNAREQTGEGSKELNFQSFVEKLKENEVVLAKKYGARTVRFKVIIKQGQVTLKPVPLP
jgi:hypothetical protein